MCFNSRSGSFLPPLFCDGTQLPPTQKSSNTSVWCAKGRSIWTLELTQLCNHSCLVLSESSNSSRAMTLLTDYTLISGFSESTQFLLSCMQVRYGLATHFLRQGTEMDNPLQKWLLTVLKRNFGVRHHSFVVYYARVWPGAPAAQLVLCCNASVKFPYPLQLFRNEGGFTSWHALELQVSWLLVVNAVERVHWIQFGLIGSAGRSVKNSLRLWNVVMRNMPVGHWKRRVIAAIVGWSVGAPGICVTCF